MELAEEQPQRLRGLTIGTCKARAGAAIRHKDVSPCCLDLWAVSSLGASARYGRNDELWAVRLCAHVGDVAALA